MRYMCSCCEKSMTDKEFHQAMGYVLSNTYSTFTLSGVDLQKRRMSKRIIAPSECPYCRSMGNYAL